MVWSDETQKYRAKCSTASARSGQTVALLIELEVLLGSFPESPPRPLLIRRDRSRDTTLSADQPQPRGQLEGEATIGAITAATPTSASTANCTATFDLPAGLEGAFQLVLEWSSGINDSVFVVVGVPSPDGIFTITQ